MKFQGSVARASSIAIATSVGLALQVSVQVRTGVKAMAQAVDPKPGGEKPTSKSHGFRWLIKTASDPDIAVVDPRPHRSTVEQLLDLPRPDDMPRDGSNTFYLDHRARPVETTAYTVEADIIACRLATDGDFHVTIRGASGKTLVLEMPGEEAVDRKSPFATKLKAVRKKFDDRFKPEATEKQIEVHARITGIAFFNRAGTSSKPEENLIQLHPVLDIAWLKRPTKEFVAPR